MSKKVLNTFNEGIDKDTSVNKYKNSNYFGARNVRLLTNNSLTSGALSSFPAPATILSSNYGGNSPLDGDNQGEILGATTIRDTVVLFFVITSGTNSGTSMILQKEYDSDVFELLYSDDAFTDKLNFNTNYPIDAIGRYESPTIQKIYWCDDLNVNRYINIAIDNTTKEPDKFSLSPNSEMESPFVTDVLSGGQLISGSIAYAYQLYVKNGSETVLSPHSTVIPLSSRKGQPLDNFRGDEIGIDTGLSVELEITNLDTTFDRIRIYSIHYADIDADPTINVILESDYSSSTFNHVDSGTTSLYTLTTTEYNLLKGRIFSSKTLESKKNYLFPANITELKQDIYFDARAYRFKRDFTEGVTGLVDYVIDVAGTIFVRITFNSSPAEDSSVSSFLLSGTHCSENTYTISSSANLIYDFSVVWANYQGNWSGTADYSIGDIVVYNSRLYYCHTATTPSHEVPTDLSYWDIFTDIGDTFTITGSSTASCNIYSETGVPTVVTTLNWDSVSETHDAINYFNNFDNDLTVEIPGGRSSSEEYKYQSDGSTIGGEGPNISYEFYSTNDLDSGNIEGNISGKTAGTAYNTLREINNEDNSLLNPLISSKFKGYKRGEVYRFGIEFIFKNGQKSFVKWIGDIRFPFLYEESLNSSSGTTIYNNQLGIKFYANLASLSATEKASLSGYRIVRVERKEYDKNILYQGIGGPIIESTGISFLTDGTLAFPDEITTITDAVGGTNNSANAPVNVNNYEINSPNLSIFPTRYSFKSNDELRGTGSLEQFDLNSNTTTDGDYFRETSYIQSSTECNLITSIDILKVVEPYITEREPSIGTFNSNTIYYRAIVCNSIDDLDGICARKGLYYIDAFNLTAVETYVGLSEKLILEHIRNRFRNQYSGITYESRQNSSYIPTTYIQADISSNYNLTGESGDFIPITYHNTYHDTSGSNDTLEINTFGGDTYVVNYDYLRVNWDENLSASTDKIQSYLTFPVETDINLEYRRDELNKYYTGFPDHDNDDTIYKLQNTYTGGVTMFPSSYPEEMTDLYLYNDAYSRNNNIISNVQRPSDFLEEEKFDTMILSSNKKTNGEYTDSWLNYNFNTFLEVDSEYGSINKLIKYNEKLLFFQNNGFGILAVEDRAVISSIDGSVLSLGTGAALERYDYASTNYGISRSNAVIATEDNLFFIDEQDKSIRLLGSDNKSNVSKILGISSLMREVLPSTYMSLGYDSVNKELLISLDNTTISINTIINKHISEYDIIADPSSVLPSGYHRAPYYISVKDELHNLFTEVVSGHSTINMDKLNNASFPLGDSSEVTILIHPNSTDVFVFDALDLRTNRFSSFSQNLSTDLDTAQVGIDSIDYRNSYINTTTVNLVTGSNINRLARKWRTKVPLSSNSNRFVDTYLLVTVKFDNTSNFNYTLHDVITSVRYVNK